MKKIWPFSFNFLFYAAMACLMPFLVLYFRQLGFTGFQIGLLTGLSPLVSIIAIPFWTSFADKTHHHKFVLSLAITSAVILAPVFLIVKTFVPMIALAALYSFLTAPIVSLVDNATMTMLADEKEKYGRVRVGGTIGWALTAPVAGVLIDRFGLKFSFWSYAVVMLAALFVCQPFIFGQADARVQIKGGIRTLLANRRWMLFLGLGFVGGMGIASVNNYLSLYMTQGGANKTLIGVASAMATFSELPVLFFGDRLLKRFRAQGLFVLAIAVYAVRLLLYAVSDLPAVILPFQLLNGLTFPALWMAGVSLAHENAPRGMGATAQGLFGSVVMGFGNGVGGLLCGTLFGAIGGQGMYLIIGMIVLAGLMIFGVLNRFMSASSRSRPFDILTVGKIHPELILSAPDLEPRFGQVETLVDEAHLTVGNSSAIFTCGARRLGLQVAFMGGVGDDVFGRFTLESFQGRPGDPDSPGLQGCLAG
jgi:PPP family 3-phenylpropionic acid transporter